MPHGFGGPATGEETGAKTVIVAPGGVVRVPDGVALLNARLQRAGNDLVIIPVDDGAPVLIASFFARAIVPDLEEASGMRLSGRLVAELAGRGAAAGEWAAKIAGVDAEAALAAGDAADAGEEASPSAVGAGAGEAVSPAAESALDADGVEVSAGGDENAMPGDTIAVTQAIDAFNLHPQSMAYGPSRFETIVLPPVDFSPPPDEDTALLLLRTQEQVSLPPPLEVTRWDNGRRWEAIGSFIEISGSEPEALIEAGRLITARDGFMARLEADVAISTEQIAKFLEVDPAILRAAIPASTPTSGTAMRIANSLSLAKGETIHFDVFFDGASHLPFNDAAIMTVRTQGRTLTVPISSIAELDAAGRGGSGWLTVSYTTGVAGSYAFGFAVLNDDDRSPSRLYVDHVRRGSAAGQLEATHSIADSLGGATTVHRPLPGFHEPVQQFVLSPEGTLAINALANVIDPDGYDAPRLDGVDRSGTLGAVDFDGLGNIVYDPRNFYRALAAGERGTDRFLYRIDGGNGGIAGARVEVTLSEAGVNDAPTAANDSATVDLERLARSGLPQTIAVLLNDDDVDSDDDRSTLSIVAATSEAGADVAIVRGAALAAFGLTYDAGAVAAARSLSLGETLAAADWVTYRIADRWGATAEARVAITWIGANDAPTANTDSARAGEDGAAAVVDVLANDDDVDGDDDASTLRLVAAEAERGTAQVTADHRLSISASGFAGLALGEEATYAVRYTVADRHGATADGRVDVIVAGANDAPIAIADRARAIEDGEPVAINVLANDDDIDSDDDASTLTVLSARSARGAAVVVGADGVLHYRLAGIAAFDALREGEQADAFDIITYVVSDRHGATAEGRVEVTVTGRNDPIAAGDDQFADDGFGRPRAVSEDRIDPLPVLDNDIDPDRGDTRTITHINGVAVAADGSWRALPSGAAVALLATGEIAVDPRGRFDWLAVGESATETFTYTVADGHGSNDTATVTLIVRGLNDAPVARDDIAETDAETPLRVFALANDDDPDRGDRLTLTGTDTVSDLFAVGADASVVFDPRGRLQHLSLGQTEQLWLRYEIADAHGATGQARVIVTVHGVNDAPIAGDDAVLVFADRGIAPSLGTSLLDNDGDPDQWDRLRITAINGDGAAVGRPLALPAGGLLTVLADGTFAYDPLGAFDPLASGELATVVFSYSVGDGHGAQATAQVTLVVRGVNDPPVPRADAAAVVENGAGVVVDVLANDVDPDGAAETAALRLVSAVSASGADARITGDGKIAYATLGAFDGLALGQIATDDVVYTVRDRFGAEAQGRLTVTISGRNDAPTAAADVATVAADGVAVIDVRANDDDIDADDDAASLRLVAATTAWGETVAITADGQLAIDARDIAAFRELGAGAIRTFEGAIVYTIADRHGALATGTVDLVVSGVNDPIIAVDDAFSVSEDGAAQLAVGANDVDPDLGDGRQITAINGAAAGVGDRIHLPSGAILTVLAGGSVSYDPAGSFGVLGEGEAAFDRFTYAIADDAGSGDEAAVTVTVTGRNASPVAHADTAVTQQDAEVRIAVLANDSDADVRDTLSITGIDQAQTLGRVRINADGTVTYDPAGAFAGLGAGATATDTFSYILSDGRGGAARATVTVTIHGTGHGTGETTAGSQQLLFPFEVSDGDAASARFPGWRQEPAPGSGTTAVAQIGVFDGRLAAFSTTHLDKAAVLAANGGPVTGIVDLLNLPTDSLGGTRGAALATLVSVGPADVGHDGRITLSFDWNFIGGETGNPAALDDRAVFAISNGTGVSEASRWFVFTLAELAGSDGAATGWRTSVFDLSEAFTIPPAGLSLTIGFAITGSADLVNPSRLLLDDVRFNGAPSPDATLIGGSGDDRLATWRPNPTAIDDGVVGTVGEDGALVIEAGGLVANDLASAGATAASRRMVAAGTESGRGVVSVSGGSIHYLAAGGHDDLAAGAQRVETLIYTLTDANGGTDTARARIVVTGVNDAPVAAAAALTASEDAAVAIEMPALLALARDPDSGDQLSLSGIDAAGVRGLVSADAFTIRYDPGSAFQWLAAGQTATETIQYAVQDRLGAQGSAAITITISGRNDAPTALNDAFTVSEGATSDLSVLANDSDIDGDAVRISEINGAAVPADGIYHLPSGARLIVDPARGVLFDAAGRYDWLAAGESLAERFTYTVTDSHGERGEASVTVTIAGANDPPQARSDHAVTDEDAMVRIAVLANDSDADAADRLSVLSVDTAGTIGRVRIGPDGSLVYDPDGRFDGLFAGQSVMDTFRYTAADGHGGLSTATVQVTIHGSGTPQNHPQQLLSSFEIPWQQAGPGWEAEPFASGAASPIRLTAAFAGDFGAGRAIRDDLRPVLAGYGPTHLDHAVQLAAFGSSGRGPEILTSAIERFLELPGGALPDDTGAFAGEQGDGSEANTGAAIRSRIGLTGADAGPGGTLSLSFDWNFISAETVADNAPGSNDFALFSISDGTTVRAFTLADARSTGFGASGWRTSSFEVSGVFALPAAGALDLVIGFAVLNDQTPDNPSYLIVDNVRFNREIGGDYALVGASGDGVLQTWRQNPTAFDDAVAGAGTDEGMPITIALAELTANDAASRGAASVRVAAVER
ncbi:MAG: Ig-like domain-containing protein, partial [Rhodospirillales bacterium]|nr:Ig-like domain-containing protein [Rhodospirillales bacterium]